MAGHGAGHQDVRVGGTGRGRGGRGLLRLGLRRRAPRRWRWRRSGLRRTLRDHQVAAEARYRLQQAGQRVPFARALLCAARTPGRQARPAPGRGPADGRAAAVRCAARTESWAPARRRGRRTRRSASAPPRRRPGRAAGAGRTSSSPSAVRPRPGRPAGPPRCRRRGATSPTGRCPSRRRAAAAAPGRPRRAAGPAFSPGRRTGVLRARSAMKARSASTGPSKRRTRSTGMPASWATSSAVAPARIRAWMSRGRRWLSTSISIWPRRGRSPRTAARSRSSIGSVYSVQSAAFSTSRVPSFETATTRSSGMGTSRVVPADVTCVAASASRVWPARVQPATTLPSCPACRARALASPLWHGYLFATLSDQLRHPVQLAPSWRSLKAADALAGDRTQGSQQYSIRATCVDWRAAQLLARGGAQAAR